MSLRFKILSCAYSFSAFNLYELNVINLIILFCIVFIVLSKSVDADPQLHLLHIFTLKMRED